MKKLFLFGVWFAAALFVGCDESGTSANADESSSSVAVSGESSSSVTLSGTSAESDGSSCSAKSSDSKDAESSSSVSSEVEGSSSSFSSENVESSSSFEKYINPKIDYGSLTDERDGQVYRTVKIGEQTWMAENLNYRYTQGTESLDSSSFCYDNDPKKCEQYGRHYLWSAAMDSAAVFSTDGKGCGYYGSDCSLATTVRGVCPKGWHLPSDDEWRTLVDAAGGRASAGKVLKSSRHWYCDGNGTDALGFSALPAGVRYYYGDFYDDGYYAYFWSSTEDNSYNAYDMGLYYINEDAYLDNDFKNIAFSIRCLKNESN